MRAASSRRMTPAPALPLYPAGAGPGLAAGITSLSICAGALTIKASRLTTRTTYYLDAERLLAHTDHAGHRRRAELRPAPDGHRRHGHRTLADSGVPELRARLDIADMRAWRPVAGTALDA
jgi:hypothetical protein